MKTDIDKSLGQESTASNGKDMKALQTAKAGLQHQLEECASLKNTDSLAEDRSYAAKDNSKGKGVLRKGKWTPEEEQYTNKVIEVFNSGLLKLPDHERGTTLRAYLASKLGCDPMRITKKYTGSACLGKRVYHFDYLHANHEQAERARAELQVLESAFRAKLEQLNRKRVHGSNLFMDHSRMVSTPAIDALMANSRPTPAMRPQCDNIYKGPPPGIGHPMMPPFFGMPFLFDLQAFPGFHGHLPAGFPMHHPGLHHQMQPPQLACNTAIEPPLHLLSPVTVVDIPLPQVKQEVQVVDEEDIEQLSKKVKRSESDNTEAASSLLGFFSHLQHASQEDLIDFFGGLQKVASTSSPSQRLRKQFSFVSVEAAVEAEEGARLPQRMSNSQLCVH